MCFFGALGTVSGYLTYSMLGFGSGFPLTMELIPIPLAIILLGTCVTAYSLVVGVLCMQKYHFKKAIKKYNEALAKKKTPVLNNLN